MNPGLEELRKRLLGGTSPATSPQAPACVSEERPSVDSPTTAAANEKRNALGLSRGGRPIESTAAEENVLMRDECVARAVPTASDGLAEAIAEVFEPARQCQGRLLEITQASKTISHLITRLVIEVLEPLKSFHDHIRKLSSSFQSIRTFGVELGVLAESFAPVRPLHQQVIRMAQTVQIHLTEMANGLEPARSLQLADLAAAIDSVCELQARFYELSEAFGALRVTGETPAAFHNSRPSGAGSASIQRAMN